MDVQPPHKNIADAEWRILLIDGDEDDFILIRDMLKEAKGRKIALSWAATYEAGQKKLAEDRYDAGIVDNDLGARTGIDLIRALNASGATTPLILFTGRGSYEVDIEAMQAGATAYLSKDQLSSLSLERFIRYAIEREQAENELRKNSEALRESEERFRVLFHNRHSPMLLIDPATAQIVDANPAASAFYGWSQEELTRMRISDINTLPTDQTQLEMHKAEAAATSRQFTFRHRLSNGEVRDVEVNSGPILIGQKEYLYSIVHDITERRQAEEALRKSEEKFSKSFRSSPVAIAISTVADGRFIEVNDSYTYLFGFSREELIGHSSIELGMFPDPQARQDIVQRFRAGGGFRNYEIRLRTKSGEDRDVLFATEPIEIDGQDCMLSLVVDITERKRVEAALAASERKSRELIQYAPTAIYEIDFRTQRFTTVNDAMVVMSGYSREELLQMSAYDLAEEQSWALLDERMRQWQFSPPPTKNAEYVVKTKDGRLVDALIDITVNVDENGRPLSGTVIAHDITERKQAETALHKSEAQLRASEADLRKNSEALRESEQKFSVIFEKSAFAAVLSTYPNAVLVAVNEAWEKLFGYTRQEAIGKTSLELGLIVDAQNRAQLMDQIIELRTLHELEMSFQTKSGERRDLLLNIDVVDIRGEPFILNTMTDITERKRAENELRKSEATLHESEERERHRAQELSAILDAVPAYIFITHDPDSRTMIANRATNELLRSRPGDNISKSAPEPEIPRQFRAMRDGKEIPNEELPVQLAAAKCMHVEDFEFDIVFEDGSSRRLMGNAAPLCDEHGDPAGAVGAFIDITELRRIEQETSERIAMMEVQHRLLEHREMERSQLARELHDGPIQSLGGLGFSLQMLQSAVENQEAREMIEQVKQDVRDLAGELRGVCNELRPPLLERFGFRKAVQAHMDGFRERHPEIKLDMDIAENPDKLPENIATALFRVYQEALNNVVRHSEATEISIQFAFDPQQILLEIHDNGKGLPEKVDWVELVRQGHFGLVGMKERAEAIGGEFQAQSSLGMGTTIRITVPITK